MTDAYRQTWIMGKCHFLSVHLGELVVSLERGSNIDQLNQAEVGFIMVMPGNVFLSFSSLALVL